MSTKTRRVKRSGTQNHGGTGNASVNRPIPGDDPATDLTPDRPTNYAKTPAVSLTYNAINQVATVAVNDGGTLYDVSDVLTIVGGTGTACTVTVTAVSGGVITGIEVTTGGSYTVDPAATGATSTGHTGDATFDLTFEDIDTIVRGSGSFVTDGWLAGMIVTVSGTANNNKRLLIVSVVTLTLRVAKVSALTEVKTAVIATGGTGYSDDDVLTIVGGTGIAATVTVTGETAGVIDTISLTTPGSYDVNPATPAAVTDAGNSDATVTLTFGAGNSVVQETVSSTLSSLNQVPGDNPNQNPQL